MQETSALFRIGISPYYLSLIDPEHPFCPVRMQSIPVRAEARVRPGELADPLGEDKTRPEEAIVHKYPDRVLFLALDTCSVYCRHCTRRRITKGGEAELTKEQMRRGHRVHPRATPRCATCSSPAAIRSCSRDERLEELLAPLQRDSPRGDDPHRHARAGVPAHARHRRAGAHCCAATRPSTSSPTSTTRRR